MAPTETRRRPLRPAQLTVGDLFDRFMRDVSPKRHKPKWETNRITWFIREYPKLAGVPLLEVTPKHFADWRDERLEFVEGSMVTRDMGFFSVIFSTARDEWQLIAASPLTNRLLKYPRRGAAVAFQSAAVPIRVMSY